MPSIRLMKSTCDCLPSPSKHRTVCGAQAMRAELDCQAFMRPLVAPADVGLGSSADRQVLPDEPDCVTPPASLESGTSGQAQSDQGLQCHEVLHYCIPHEKRDTSAPAGHGTGPDAALGSYPFERPRQALRSSRLGAGCSHAIKRIAPLSGCRAIRQGLLPGW